MELRSYSRAEFQGVQCNRIDLTLDRNIHKMAQHSGLVFVCGQPVNTTGHAYFKLVSYFTLASVVFVDMLTLYSIKCFVSCQISS